MSDDPKLNPSDPVTPDPTDPEALNLGRREALEKLGKLAYTAPVLMTFMLTPRRAAASPFDPCQANPPPDDCEW
ncbi:MAG: hypothetical protein F9K25_09625 [Candidatus Contendobacter sp.]|nr:MAG: hypothetical protein F9K25_09625 [Candidatus Contendobacter sp.]